MTSSNERLHLHELQEKKIEISMKRLDLLNPPIHSNKYFKLKYNLREARRQNHHTILTFGGAFSNHILATARAGKEYGFKTIGVIRGDELAHRWRENPTLSSAHEDGMYFKFIDRNQYRNKMTQEFASNLKQEFGPFYLLPEGGTNHLAVKGCEEILEEEDREFDYICCSVGTGGTLAGLVNSSGKQQINLGFTSLKGDFLKEDIRKFTAGINWQLVTDYHFGGYAKVNKELVEFINGFKRNTGISLDPVYTGKMMFGIVDAVKQGFFPSGTSILAVHSGGQQGIEGINALLKKKKMPQIDL